MVLFATGLLAFVGYYYGYRFLLLKNYLMAFEWWIIGISASNMFVYQAAGIEMSGYIAAFLDAFSRSIGIPLIAVVGLMKAINGYEPSKSTDVFMFVFGGIVAGVLLFVPAGQAVSPYVLLVATLGYCLFAFWLSGLLFRLGRYLISICFILVTCLSIGIAAIYDFWVIPNDSTNVFFNFYTLAQLVWASGFALTYHVYTSLLAAKRPASRNNASSAGDRTMSLY